MAVNFRILSNSFTSKYNFGLIIRHSQIKLLLRVIDRSVSGPWDCVNLAAAIEELANKCIGFLDGLRNRPSNLWKQCAIHSAGQFSSMCDQASGIPLAGILCKFDLTYQQGSSHVVSPGGRSEIILYSVSITWGRKDAKSRKWDTVHN